jgi:hypothetical protein
MPRPPLGDKAMTDAERQRRRRERLRQEQGPKPKPDKTASADLIEARKRIAALEKQLEAEQARPAKEDGKGKPSSEPETMKSLRLALGKAWDRVSTLERELNAATKPTEEVVALRKRITALEGVLAHERQQHAANQGQDRQATAGPRQRGGSTDQGSQDQSAQPTGGTSSCVGRGKARRQDDQGNPQHHNQRIASRQDADQRGAARGNGRAQRVLG